MTKLMRKWGLDYDTDRAFEGACNRRGIDSKGVFTYDKESYSLKEFGWSVSPKYLFRWTIIPEAKSLEELL